MYIGLTTLSSKIPPSYTVYIGEISISDRTSKHNCVRITTASLLSVPRKSIFNSAVINAPSPTNCPTSAPFVFCTTDHSFSREGVETKESEAVSRVGTASSFADTGNILSSMQKKVVCKQSAHSIKTPACKRKSLSPGQMLLLTVPYVLSSTLLSSAQKPVNDSDSSSDTVEKSVILNQLPSKLIGSHAQDITSNESIMDFDVIHNASASKFKI
mmetsp:Transcript_34345/g.53622  ORF Transcript_34345/g.53622 Transcript_34345/m.53622 type:complete len:214 (-) Transcript_34345:467-1108(-)